MKFPIKSCHLLAGLSLGLLLSTGRAQEITQTIRLQPGWNSVWVEVQPADNTSETVFGGLPIRSVWTRVESALGVDFIQNVSEEEFNRAEWQRWFPPGAPEAVLNNLFAVLPNRAYLIHVTSSSAVDWEITGRPSLRRLPWAPDAFTLRGLPVEAENPPTFLNFFRASPAHFQNGQLEGIYRLNSAGEWTQAGPNDRMRPGEACWVYTHGASDYVAPLEVKLELGDGLDFGANLTELDFRVANRSGAPLNALVRNLGPGETDRLAYYEFDPAAGGEWPVLGAELAISLGAGGESELRLAVRRQVFTTPNYATILEVRDGAGTRLLVPVSGELPDAPAAGAGVLRQAGAPASTLAGLWVGLATVNAVSEAHGSDPETPTPTKSEFSLRLIIHVDGSGQARLLKEVTQMWKDGTYVTNPSGDLVPDQPGEFVLLTDDRLIPFFNGAALRDGEPVGRRISSVGYEFPSEAAQNYLEMTGSFAIGERLGATLTMPFDAPTNPFKHKYHPDHDNLNARFDGPAAESFTTSRTIELAFAASPPEGPAVPDFGYNEMGGSYRESISGIHKQTIQVSGVFRLSRVSLIAELNPTPTP